MIKVIDKNDDYDFREALHFAPKKDDLRLVYVVIADYKHQYSLAEDIAINLTVDHMHVEHPNFNPEYEKLIIYIYECVGLDG